MAMTHTALLLLAALGLTAGQLATQKTLVVLDDMGHRATHSGFFRSLTDRGHALTFMSAANSELSLASYGKWEYDSLVLMAPTVEEFEGTLDVSTVVDFIDSGHSAFIMGGTTNGHAVREIVAECGVEFDDEDTIVMDHSAYDVADGDFGNEHSLIVADQFSETSVITGDAPKPVLYHGAGLAVVDENELLVKVLTGGEGTYSHAPLEAVEGTPFGNGEAVVLVAALQARNNARVVISGSLDMFSDELAGRRVQGKTASGNGALGKALAGWTFGHVGVLRAVNFNHQLAGANGSIPPAEYTVQQEVTYSFDVQQWVEGAWAPYTAKDVQLELVMLDPYYRLTMEGAGGKYAKTFTLPDVYGVFQFVLDYNRPGLTKLSSAQQVTVRPLRHDEFERFIPAAYPYYASALSTLGAFFAFSVFFLYAEYK